MGKDLYEYSPSIYHFRYYENEKKLVHNSISTIFSLDHKVYQGGVYLYYSLKPDEQGNIDVNDILYIGMTSNYANRFYDHNISKSRKGTKRHLVDDFFKKTNLRLGILLFAFDRADSFFNYLTNDDDKLRYCAFGPKNEELHDAHNGNNQIEYEFNDYKNKFEKCLANAYKEKQGRFPLWWEDKDCKDLDTDESSIQARGLISYLLDEDPQYPCDYKESCGFRTAKKMQENI